MEEKGWNLGRSKTKNKSGHARLSGKTFLNTLNFMFISFELCQSLL